MPITTTSYDVLIIGAGPAGTCAAALLRQNGYSVAIIEKESFPRFSIGESLLPQSMVFLKNAGLLDDVIRHGFQEKNGAVFLCNDAFSTFNFEDKYTNGPFTTFQVKRSNFDKVLADTCVRKGVKIYYKHAVTNIKFSPSEVNVSALDLTTNQPVHFYGRFVLDASGFGRVLPKLLNLDKKSDFPVRRAIFGHVKIKFPEHFDIKKILITVDPQDRGVWLWTIPLSDNTCSIGVVAKEEYYAQYPHLSDQDILLKIIEGSPKLNEILKNSEFITDCRSLTGYASNVTSLYGDRFALLGNAGEFLDPIFSSGVTIALHSAELAAGLICRQLKGETVNWETDFSQALKVGVETFKAFVNAWYNYDLQSIIFYPKPDSRIKKMICSILAGYAWDQTNPYVVKAEVRIRELANMCRLQTGKLD